MLSLTLLSAVAVLTGPAPPARYAAPRAAGLANSVQQAVSSGAAATSAARGDVVPAAGVSTPDALGGPSAPPAGFERLGQRFADMRPVTAASDVPSPVEEGAPEGSQQAPPPPSPRRDFVMLKECMVSLIEDLEIAAQEDGLLTSLEAREGMHLKKDLQLGQVDDREAQAKHAAALSAHRRAKTEADNDANIRAAEVSAEVAREEYEVTQGAKVQAAGSFAPSEVRRRKLAWDKAVLAIQQAQMEQQKARHEMEAKSEEIEMAKLAIQRRKILSPIGGVVINVKKRQGSWLTKGEPLLRIVRMDRLRVAAHVNAEHYGPHEVLGRPVSIRAHLERGRTERFKGKVTFVHPEQNGGDYLVWAEVDNRLQDDQWVLRPGLQVEMAIHLANQTDSGETK